MEGTWTGGRRYLPNIFETYLIPNSKILNHLQGRRVHLHLPERRAVPGRVRFGGAPGRLGDHGPGAAHTRILTLTRGNTQLISVNRLVSHK